MGGLSGSRAIRGVPARRTRLRGLQAALSTVSAGLRACFEPAGPSLAALSDRQLRDLGLTRDDVALPDRMSSAERDIRRLLDGPGWR